MMNWIHDQEGQLRKQLQFLNRLVDEQGMNCALNYHYSTFRIPRKSNSNILLFFKLLLTDFI